MISRGPFQLKILWLFSWWKSQQHNKNSIFGLTHTHTPSPPISHQCFGNWKSDILSWNLLNSRLVNSFYFYFSTFSKALLNKKLIFHRKKPSNLLAFLCQVDPLYLLGPYLILITRAAKKTFCAGERCQPEHSFLLEQVRALARVSVS